MTEPQHVGQSRSGFDTYEVWKQYQTVAMHFNDLLMRLRSQSLAAVGALATIAGVVVKTGVDPAWQWITLTVAFLVLMLFWTAIWILDFRYYNRLLVGAVDALIDIEKQSARDEPTRALILSTCIEAVVAEGKPPRHGKLSREPARWWFYGIVFATLFLGFAGASVAALLTCQICH